MKVNKPATFAPTSRFAQTHICNVPNLDFKKEVKVQGVIIKGTLRQYMRTLGQQNYKSKNSKFKNRIDNSRENAQEEGEMHKNGKEKRKKRENQAQMLQIILFLKNKEMRMEEFAKEFLSFSDFIPEGLAVSPEQ